MTLEEFLQNVRAFLSVANFRDQQMPDPGEYADLRWLLKRPPDLHRLLALSEEQYFQNPYGVVWGTRKHDRSLRHMVLANPFAELHLRTLLHPAADLLIEAQSDHALAGRLDLLPESTNGARALSTANPGSMHGRYRKRLGKMKRRTYTAGVRTDVRKCYHEITPEAVVRAFALMGLRDIGMHVGLALRKCAGDTGLDGLPINPETSGWIANIVLRDSDLSFARFPQVDVARWSDDYVLAAGTPRLVFECFAELRTNLGAVGLKLAEDKTHRAPNDGLTVPDLIDMRSESQADIWASVDAKDPDRLGELLLEELNKLTPSPARLRALFGQSVKESLGTPENSTAILSYMLEYPSSWEQSCPRAASFLGLLANPEQRLKMIHTAIDLASEGLVASEQVVHLLRASIAGPEPFAPESPREVARLLWRLANTRDCVPVRGWARRVAFEFDPEWVNERVIYAGQYEDFHPFEQRWAISFANHNRDRWWLECRADYGRWPSMADARLSSGLLR